MKAVNLLPADLRSGAKGPAPAVSAGTEIAGGPGPFIVLGVLALCVVALAGYILTSNTVKSRESELAAISARSAATNREVAALRPYADFQSLARERITTVRDLATSRFDWEQALRDLSRAMPKNVTLASMKGTVSSQAGGAGGSSGGGNLRGALDVPAIELSGCVPTQTDVAELMSRLRNVDGVTRVSLSKSDKATELQTNSSNGAGAEARPACGRLNAPGFELVAFFETDAAAAVAPTGAAVAQPATTTGTPAATATPAAGQPAAAPGTPAPTGQDTP